MSFPREICFFLAVAKHSHSPNKIWLEIPCRISCGVEPCVTSTKVQRRLLCCLCTRKAKTRTTMAQHRHRTRYPDFQHLVQRELRLTATVVIRPLWMAYHILPRRQLPSLATKLARKRTKSPLSSIPNSPCSTLAKSARPRTVSLCRGRPTERGWSS